METTGPVEGPKLVLESAAAADPGLVREKQEDAHLLMASMGFVAVADGMGGHQAGDVASRLAVETLREHFGRIETGTQPRGLTGLLRRLGVGNQPGDALTEAIRSANKRILGAARRDEAHRGMGTTVVALWLCGDAVHYAHVGDSRIYLWRKGELIQLTDDHSLANEYLRQGLLTQETLATFAHKNVIVRAVGLSPGIEVDVGSVPAEPEDRFLLCSDGLTDLVDDARIRAVLAQADEPGAAARELVALALEAGGIDNVTALVAQIRAVPTEVPEVKDDQAPIVRVAAELDSPPDGDGG